MFGFNDQNMTLNAQIIDFINHKENKDLDLAKYNELKTDLIDQLQSVSGEDYEEVATLNYYLLVLGLECGQVTLEEVDRLYFIIKNSFERQEEYIKNKFKALDKQHKKVLKSQLEYFYKLVEHYYKNLRDLFRKKYFLEHAKKAHADNLQFSANQRLLEGKFIDYFEYKRIELSIRFRAHYLIYTIVGGIGMIIFWRGVWDLTYQIPIIAYPLGSVVVGLLIMVFTGFIASVGDRSIIGSQENYDKPL